MDFLSARHRPCDTIFPDFHDLVQLSIKLKIHVGNDAAIDLHGALGNQPPRLARGLREAEHIGQKAANPNRLPRRKLIFNFTRN